MVDFQMIRPSKNGVILEIQLAPRASKEQIMGLYNGRLKISVMAPPVDGKANAAICKFLAKKVKVPASSVQVVRGQTSREKSIEFEGISEKDLTEALELS